MKLSPANGTTTSCLENEAWVRTTTSDPDESWAKLQETEAAAARKLAHKYSSSGRPKGIEVSSKVDHGKLRKARASTAPKAIPKAGPKTVSGQQLDRHALAQPATPATRAKAVHLDTEKEQSAVAAQRQKVPDKKRIANGHNREQQERSSAGVDAMAKIAGATQTSVALPHGTNRQLTRKAQAQRVTRAEAVRSLEQKGTPPAKLPQRGVRASDKGVVANRRSETDEKYRVPSNPLLKLRSVESSAGVDVMAKIAGKAQTSMARPQDSQRQLTREAQAQKVMRAEAVQSLKKTRRPPAEPPPRGPIPRSPVRSQTNVGSEEGIPPVRPEGKSQVPSTQLPRHASLDRFAGLDAMAKIAGATHARWRTVNPASEPP